MEPLKTIALASTAALLLVAAGCGGDTEYAEEPRTQATVETSKQSIQEETTDYLQERSDSLRDDLEELKAEIDAAGNEVSQETRDAVAAMERQLDQADEQMARLGQQAQATGGAAWNSTKNAVESAYTEIENGLSKARDELGKN